MSDVECQRLDLNRRFYQDRWLITIIHELDTEQYIR